MKNKKISRMLVMAFGLLCSKHSAYAGVNSNLIQANQIPGFHTVLADKIYRGAQPTDLGLVELKYAGIKTVIDLRNESDEIDHELRVTRSIDLRFISVPLGSVLPPSDSDIKLIEKWLDRKELQPVFVHCQHGQDRTGLVAGLYRVYYQGWSPAQAYSEMLSLGFHPILLGLTYYYVMATGYGL